MSHTPGPWTAAPRDGSGIGGFVIGSNDGAVVVVPQHSRPPEEVEANARLIASAPEMLEALKAIDAYWSNGNFSRQRELWDPVRDAIAKAEGRQS